MVNQARNQVHQSELEEFKPIPIQRADSLLGRFAFELRKIVDLQLLTCVQFLAPLLEKIDGKTLDVGCGEIPFKRFLSPHSEYTGLDIIASHEFGMQKRNDIIAFDGKKIPFSDQSFDCVLCTEVLEHVEDYSGLIKEMHRVLRDGGELIVTVPFSARVHHSPYDFHRFTRYRLMNMFQSFKDVRIIERGNDITVIANKLIVISMRNMMKVSKLDISSIVTLFLIAPVALIALGIAHASLIFSFGSKADPLGYGIHAIKGTS